MPLVYQSIAFLQGFLQHTSCFIFFFIIISCLSFFTTSFCQTKCHKTGITLMHLQVQELNLLNSYCISWKLQTTWINLIFILVGTPRPPCAPDKNGWLVLTDEHTTPSRARWPTLEHYPLVPHVIYSHLYFMYLIYPYMYLPVLHKRHAILHKPTTVHGTNTLHKTWHQPLDFPTSNCRCTTSIHHSQYTFMASTQTHSDQHKD